MDATYALGIGMFSVLLLVVTVGIWNLYRVKGKYDMYDDHAYQVNAEEY
jgi:uncharacterized membrane protein